MCCMISYTFIYKNLYNLTSIGSAKFWLKLLQTESVLSGKSKITFSANKGQTEDIKENQHKVNQNNSTQNPSTQTKH